MNPWIAIKFGGTSVSGTAQWAQIIEVIKHHIAKGRRVMVVHSAFSGITNALEGVIQNQPESLGFVEQRLKEMATALEVDFDACKKHWKRLKELANLSIKSPNQEAELLGMGEWCTNDLCLAHISKSLPTQSFNPHKALVSKSDDARNPKSQALSAQCDIKPSESWQKQLTGECYLMPGFVASNTDGEPVVLGRGGSDTSAAYMAVLLNAERLEIWTDVHGIFSANPHAIPTARLLTRLGYQEAREIAASGGAVLHPRCILPVEQAGIPLAIKNTSDPKAEGTVLSHAYQPSKPTVYAINTRHQVTLVSLESINMWHQAGFMADMFSVFKNLGLSIDLVSTAQTNVTLSLDKADNVLSQPVLDQLSEQLSHLGEVTLYKNCSAVTLVGYRIRAMADQIASVVSTFADQRIYITTQSSNDLNQTFVVDEDQADKLTRALHDVLIPNDDSQAHFGPSWHQLRQKNTEKQAAIRPWWHHKRDDLLALAADHSPCYAYDSETIVNQIDQLKSLSAVDKIHYACKANSTDRILSLVAEQGLSFETVSPQEIERVEHVLTDNTASRMLFTPNFAPKAEYQWAMDKGIITTIDNPMILQQWTEVFSGHEVILRIDPGHGSGHHRYVRTAGEQSKFGIPVDTLPEIAAICRENNIKVIGLHAHSGSGILDHNNWQRVVEALQSHRHHFPDVRILNIGGGLGIKENPGDVGLDFDAFNEQLLRFKNNHPDTEIWIEPGRFIVANSGVLLAKVTQTKWKGQQGYIGIETGMNSLIRPALYGAWHNIVNLSRLDQNKEYTANVVGPMCETGDILGIDRKMPKTEVGDVLLIANAGAYGTSMASNYNLRAPASNILL